MADRIMVMKDGRMVEEGPTEAIFDAPARGLYAAADGGSVRWGVVSSEIVSSEIVSSEIVSSE